MYCNLRSRLFWTVCLSLSLLGLDTSLAQQDVASKDLATKVYRVKDIVLPTPNYSLGEAIQSHALPGAVRGGFGRGGGGGFGGGFFAVPSAMLPAAAVGQFGTADGGRNVMRDSVRITLSDLADAITHSIAPESWDSVGGLGSINGLGGMLIIRQTPEIHDEIKSLMADLRSEGATIRSVTIHAHWIVIDP